MSEKTYSQDLVLQEVQERNGKTYVIAESLNSRFEPIEGLEEIALRSKNKDWVWRHSHPLKNPIFEIYGRVDDSWVDKQKGKLYTRYEIYDFDEERKNFKDLVNERIKIKKPLGISLQYRKFYIEKTNEAVHYDVFEHSGTPFPKCQECITISSEVKQMSLDEKKKDEKIEDEKLEDEDITEMEESEKKIKELEDKLNAKINALEEYKSKVEKLEDDLKAKATSLAEESKKAKTLTERISELESKVDYLKKKPILDKIKELKKLDERLENFYKAQDEKYLGDVLKQFEAESQTKIQIKSHDESAKDSNKKLDEELEDDGKKEKVTFDQFTRQLNLKKKNKEK
jgi:hypothetical protein